MTSVVRRRQRIVRVRRVQHLHVAAAAAQAEGRALHLESTSDRLRDMRAEMVPSPGMTFGSTLSNVAELGMRLEKVREGLTEAIVGARAAATEQAALRLAARIREESAIRLQERSAAAWEADREKRLSRIGGRRKGEGPAA